MGQIEGMETDRQISALNYHFVQNQVKNINQEKNVIIVKVTNRKTFK